MKKWIIMISSIITYVLGIGLYFSNRIMYMKKKDEEFIKNREIESKRFIEEEYDALPKLEVLLPSPSGYTLKCIFLEPHETKKWIIISHGVTENKINSIKYANIFLKIGYNAVIYDHRRHGESEGKTTSYGYYEKFDLQSVIREVKKRKGNDIILGVHGESMGAVTALLYAGMLDNEADFYIVDCPFSNFDKLLQYQLREEVSLPAWAVLPIGKTFVKMRDGYWTKDISPIDHIHKIEKPILFIHSIPDRYIPVNMTMELYKAKKGPKQLYLATIGAHARSYNENAEQYEQEVASFLQKYVHG